jgi:hypothetical protein
MNRWKLQFKDGTSEIWFGYGLPQLTKFVAHFYPHKSPVIGGEMID